jgi:hypothetical protein
LTQGFDLIIAPFDGVSMRSSRDCHISQGTQGHRGQKTAVEAFPSSAKSTTTSGAVPGQQYDHGSQEPDNPFGHRSAAKT